MTHLVHLLDAITRRVAAKKQQDEAEEKARKIAEWESYLARVACEVTDLIRENSQSLSVDSRFTERGLEFPVWPSEAYYEHVAGITVSPGNPVTTGAWRKFVTGWLDAGIRVFVRQDLDRLVTICFQPK